jgi:hypothetical protein
MQLRISSTTVGVEYRDDDPKGNGVAVFLPAGAMVLTDDPLPAAPSQPSRMISVKWEGRVINMFIVDLLERGEQVSRASEQ